MKVVAKSGISCVLFSLCLVSSPSGQDAVSLNEAKSDMKNILNRLSEQTGVIIFAARYKQFVGGEYPLLGLAGYREPEGSGDMMVFIPCEGDVRDVPAAALADTIETCPESSSEKPKTVLVGLDSFKIVGAEPFGKFDVKAYTWEASVGDLKGTTWSSGDFTKWLDAAKKGEIVASVSDPIGIEKSRLFVVDDFTLGGTQVLALGVPVGEQDFVSWLSGDDLAKARVLDY